MANFYGTVRGAGKEKTCTGTKNSGLRVRARGWSIGVDVYADVDRNGNDCMLIVMNEGSSGNDEREQVIGKVTLDDNGKPVFVTE